MSVAVVKTFDPSSGQMTSDQQTTYGYDSAGNRVSALVQTDTALNGTYNAGVLTEFLNDPQNATGYSQVLEQTTTDQTTGQIQKVVVYAIGLSLISQTTTTYTNGVSGTPQTLVFGYDGHGSVRVLLDMTAAIATIAGVQQIFHYDAYGSLLNLTPLQAATTILYSGQMLDPNTGIYDNRARWYDPNTGRFLQLDPYFGNLQDPQSLHKYLYADADPVDGADPAGLANVPGDVYLRVGTKVHWIFSAYVYYLGLSQKPGAKLKTILPNDFPPGTPYRDEKPDLVNIQAKEYFDLKPVTWAKDSSKLSELNWQMTKYDNALAHPPLNYQRGKSKSLTFNMMRMPLGMVKDGDDWYSVTLIPAQPKLGAAKNIDGRGVLWYELDKLDSEDTETPRLQLPQALGVPVDVAPEITLFDYGYGGGWIPVVAVLATMVGVRLTLHGLALWSLATVPAGATVSFQSNVSVIGANASMGVAA